MTQADLVFDAQRSGRTRAVAFKGARTRRYVQLLQLHPLTDQAAAELLGVGVSSINSIRGDLGELVIAVGTQKHHFTEGRSTTRTVWGYRDLFTSTDVQ